MIMIMIIITGLLPSMASQSTASITSSAHTQPASTGQPCCSWLTCAGLSSRAQRERKALKGDSMYPFQSRLELSLLTVLGQGHYMPVVVVEEAEY